MVDAPEARARRRLFLAVFGVLSLGTLVPIWSARFPPLLEFPDHLDAIAVWHRYHDASWGYSRFYASAISLPYWGYYFPVHLLSYLLPLEIANKLYLSAYAVLLPLSIVALARRLGRNPWLALFAFPLVFNMSFAYGFIPFCGALVLLNFAIAALDAFLESPTRKRGIALCLLSLALYTTHVLPWLFFLLATVLLAGCHGWHPRRIAVALALEFPSLLLGMLALRAGSFAYESTGERLLSRLQQAPVRLIAGWGSDVPYWLLLALASAWLLLLMTAHLDHEGEQTQSSGFHYRLELLVLAALLVYLIVPMKLQAPVNLWMVDGCFLSIAALLATLLPVGDIAGARRWMLAPVLAIAFAYPIVTTVNWVRYDRRAASFRRLMHQVPRGASTLVVTWSDPADPTIDTLGTPFTHYHAYAQYLAGGFDPWTLPTGFPYKAKPERALPAPRWRHFHEFDFESQGVRYDYIVTKGEEHEYDAFGPDDAPLAPIVATDGDFRLYRVQKAAAQP